MKEELHMIGTEFNVRAALEPVYRYLTSLWCLENQHNIHLWLYRRNDTKYAPPFTERNKYRPNPGP